MDILEVNGHPDDDIQFAAYVAKLVEQQHKRVAVIYTTRGNSGGNAAGPEQSKALADIREMEARHSLASYGVTDAWFHARPGHAGQAMCFTLWKPGDTGRRWKKLCDLFRITVPM